MESGSEESETELLINAVQSRPFLYNRRDAKYKKVYLKKQAWEHIASKIPSFEDASSAERRWNSLRGKYSTELLRVMNNDVDRINKWKYFDQLVFLKEHVNPRTSLYQQFQATPTTNNFRPVDSSNSWSPGNEFLSQGQENSNADQYYSNLLNLLNNDEDSVDNSNGNDARPQEKNVKMEHIPPVKVMKVHSNGVNVSPVKVQSPKRTSSRVFGEYVGEFLEELGDSGVEVQLKIMQILADSKKKQPETPASE